VRGEEDGRAERSGASLAALELSVAGHWRSDRAGIGSTHDSAGFQTSKLHPHSYEAIENPRRAACEDKPEARKNGKPESELGQKYWQLNNTHR